MDNELINELKKLNEELLCEQDKARQMTLINLDSSASLNKRELPRHKTLNSIKLSNGSEAEADDSPITS